MRRALEVSSNLEVTVLDKLTYAGNLENLALLDRPIEFVKGDINDAILVDNLIKRHDCIVNFAAESHNDNSIKNPDVFFDTNVLGTLQLVKSAVRFDKRFHHVSTDEVFGDLPIGSTLKFNRLSQYAPSSPYSASKAASDHIVRSWVRTYGLQATISNCSNNFGPFQHSEKLIPQIINLASRGVRPKIYGSGQNVRDWIHVDDHNDGVLAILDKGLVGQTYLLGANNLRSNIQVVQAVLSHLGLQPDFFELIEDRPGHDRQYAIDASETIDEIGWSPKLDSFESQLPAVIDHYLKR